MRPVDTFKSNLCYTYNDITDNYYIMKNEDYILNNICVSRESFMKIIEKCTKRIMHITKDQYEDEDKLEYICKNKMISDDIIEKLFELDDISRCESISEYKMPLRRKTDKSQPYYKDICISDFCYTYDPDTGNYIIMKNRRSRLTNVCVSRDSFLRIIEKHARMIINLDKNSYKDLNVLNNAFKEKLIPDDKIDKVLKYEHEEKMHSYLYSLLSEYYIHDIQIKSF